jgi:cysteine sulfinate desulfinase/cysteine desulfurase-like protein
MIYFDNAASTEVDLRFVESVTECLTSSFANQEAAHLAGYNIRKEISELEKNFLQQFSVNNKFSFVWGGSGTDIISNLFRLTKFSKGNIVTTDIEHPAVTNALKMSGAEIRYLELNSKLMVKTESLIDLIDENTVAVVIHLVQSESGVMQDLHLIADVISNSKLSPLLIVDAIQGIGKRWIGLDRADIIIGSAHKFGGAFAGFALLNDKMLYQQFISLRKDKHSVSRVEPAALIPTLSF